jgi:hypothetical protein
LLRLCLEHGLDIGSNGKVAAGSLFDLVDRDTVSNFDQHQALSLFDIKNALSQPNGRRFINPKTA